MMQVKCPKCATLLKFQPQASAVRIKCPKCETMLKVGGPSPKSSASPSPKKTKLGPTKSGPSKPRTAAGQGAPKRAAAASNPTVLKKAAAKKKAAKKTAPAKAAAKTPAAAPAPGGFDLGSLDLPDPIGFGGGGLPAPASGDPLATPAAVGLPPASPILRPKAVPGSGAPAVAKSGDSGNRTVLWVGLAVAGLVLMLIVGGLAFFFMGSSESSTAERSDSSASEESQPPETRDGSSDLAAATASPDRTEPSDLASRAPAESAPPVADAIEESAPSTGNSTASRAVLGESTTYSVGGVSAAFPSGQVLEKLPTGIEGQAVRSEATKSTMYLAVGKFDPEITDQEKMVRQVERLVMADIYAGEPCQRSNRQGIQGRLDNGLVLPSMEVELYMDKGEAIILGWGRPQHEVDLFTPLILQQKKPPVEFDPEVVEAEKAAFWDSVRLK